MLCFVCLIEARDAPAKGVTWFQGTALCREHCTAVGAADAMSLSYKIRQRLSAPATTNNKE